MKLRAALLACLFGAAFFWLRQEVAKGRFDDFEPRFLDFLVANARDRFEKQPLEPSDEVVLVEFREEDKAEFSAWPPAPIDYLMVLKKLAAHDPEVLAFAMPLAWGDNRAQFLSELKDALIAFPSVVLGFSATANPPGVPDVSPGELEVHGLTSTADDASPSFGLTPLGVPEASLRTQVPLGFLSWIFDDKKNQRDLLVARLGGQFIPSLSMQAAGLLRRVPFSEERLSFGRGAGLYLGKDWFVPLAMDGSAVPALTKEPVKVSALDLMTPDLGDDSGGANAAKLGSHKLFVLSMTPSSWSGQARAAAWALAMPKLHRADASRDWMAAGIVAALGFWQLRQRRMGALVFGFTLAACALLACILPFQSSLTWWSPLAALMAISVSTAFCFVWPNSAVRTTEAPPAAG